MNANWRFLLGVACGAALVVLPKAVAHLHAAVRTFHDHASPDAVRAHTEERFVFTAHAPMEQAAPLFGADKERVWAPRWDPQFIHPSPAADGQGMVFTVAHDHLRAAWVNTAFDLKVGRVQYVYVIPDHLVTVITINLQPQGNQTRVEVQYDRTALSAEADTHALNMAKHDREAGPEWEKQINAYLEKR